MTHKFERVCWSCGSKTLSHFPDYVVCMDCGATWNPVPRVGASPVTVEDYHYLLDGEPVGYKHARPSGAIARRQAKRGLATAEKTRPEL